MSREKNTQMRFYQFGRVKEVPVEQMKQELIAIGFFEENFVSADFPSALRTVFTKVFPECSSKSALDGCWQEIAATAQTTLADCIEEAGDSIDTVIFYNITLQLLGISAYLDFELGNSLEFMDNALLPRIDAERIDESNLIEAVYLLLQTRMKIGLTFLDYLASKGFYQHNFNLKKSGHLLFNGKVQATFDTKRLIRELIYVESPLDTDCDGQRDLLEVAVYRPVETEQGVKVPALFTADPYYKGIEDESKVVHDVNVDIQPKFPNQTTAESIRYKEKIMELPEKRTVLGRAEKGSIWNQDNTQYTMDDYFLARGFAQVYSAGVGTRGSDGLRMGAGTEETVCAVAVIEWLTGKRRAFSDRTSQKEVKAWWCNGKVAMTGISYLGTLSIAAATTGVQGLETIISESGISSWYDYYRDHGLVIAPVACQGEDTDVLAQFTFSRQENAGEFGQIREVWEQERARLIAGQDRQTGDYNAFWDERNYRNHTDKIKCDVILVRGLNDWNVKSRNAEKIWAQLRGRKDIVSKLILHQGVHQHIHNFRSLDYLDMMNLWLSYKLLDVENQADHYLPSVLIQDNTESQKWQVQQDWASPENKKLYFSFEELGLKRREAIPSDENEAAGNGNDSGPKKAIQPVNGGVEISFIDDDTEQFLQGNQNVEAWEQDLLKEASSYGRNCLIFKTDILPEDLEIDGIIKVTLDVAVDQDVGKISVMVVDYGECRRLMPAATDLLWLGHYRPLGFDYRWDNLQEFFLEKNPSPFKMITKGHINLANRTNAYQHDLVAANEFYRVKWEIQPTHWKILKGHQLEIVVYSTDMGMTLRGSHIEEYTLRLDGCSLEVPYVEKSN